jgi:hypothetical protein
MGAIPWKSRKIKTMIFCQLETIKFILFFYYQSYLNVLWKFFRPNKNVKNCKNLFQKTIPSFIESKNWSLGYLLPVSNVIEMKKKLVFETRALMVLPIYIYVNFNSLHIWIRMTHHLHHQKIKTNDSNNIGIYLVNRYQMFVKVA